MPAPKLLVGLPKPLLFGLYGAVGGLLGALVFAEPLWQLVSPPPPPPVPPPEPQIAVAASQDVEVYAGGENDFTVQVARAEFDEPVAVRFESLPAGVAVGPVTVPKGATEARAKVIAARGTPAGARAVKVVAEATPGGKAVAAETSVAVQVAEPARPQADVVFVLDVTGSMQWAINGVRNGIGRFAADMQRNNIDFRVGLVAFRDLTADSDALAVLKFNGDPFTTDPDTFRREVGRLRADGGGDEPESSLEAIAEAGKLPFRKGATKVLLLVTDAAPKVANQQGGQGGAAAAVRDAGTLAKQKEIDALHLVVHRNHLDTYRPLMESGTTRGEHFELSDVAGGTGFDTLLDRFGIAVRKAAEAKNPEGKPQVAGRAEAPVLSVKSLQSDRQYAVGSERRLVLAIGLWTGAIAALVCLALLAGQHHYLRGSLPAAGGMVVGLLGGLAVGLVGGAAGQGLYLLAPDNRTLGVIFRVLGWALLGGLAGAGLSLFIPNLKWTHGLLGGAVGGAVGAIGFLVVSAVAGSLVGRLAGGLLVGLCIGVMVAVVEAAFRRAWLEVRYGARETITVNLGPEPVKVGGDSRACTVWARDAVPLALRFFVRDGQVICDDVPARTETAVGNGETREVENVTVTVRTGASVAPTPPRPVAPVPPAVPKPPDPDPLDFDPVPPPAAPVRPPVPTTGARPPLPAPRPVMVPAPAAAPVVGTGDPAACPTCGRKNPGRPGSRYCVVCDQTY
jgi:Mg-chelatase subunit ChlD